MLVGAALFLICYEAWERGHVFCLRSNLIFVLVIKSQGGMGEVYVSQFAMKLAAFLSASLCPAAAWRCYQLAHDVTSIRGVQSILQRKDLAHITA